MHTILIYKLPFKLLFCISLFLHIIPLYADSTNSSILYDGTLPTNSTSVAPVFKITPGVTKQITIDLMGKSDRLSILFVEDTYQIDMYKLVIRNNNMPETSQSADFPTEETLTLTLDIKKSLLVIQGDKKFRMSKIVREKLYNVEIEVEIVQPDTFDLNALQSQSKSTNTDKTFLYYIIAGVLGGIISIIVIVKVTRTLIQKRRNHPARRITKKKSSSVREVHPEGTCNSPVFMLEEHCPEIFVAHKGSINLDEKVMSEGEIEAINHHLTPPGKKECLSSLTSLGSAMALTNASSNFSSRVISSAGSLTNVAKDIESARGRRGEGSKKTTYLEAITEEPSFLKTAQPVDSGREGKVLPAIVVKEVPMSPNKKAGVKLPKLNIGKVKSMDIEVDLESKAKSTVNIEGSQENATRSITNPTLADIRRLTHKFMTQKQEGHDSAENSESEGEEQDFKTEPANFFCCMVCKVEKRTTVVEPCGHIFACGKCVKKIAEEKRKCKLCARRVKSYHPLKNNSRRVSEKEKAER